MAHGSAGTCIVDHGPVFVGVNGSTGSLPVKVKVIV